MIGAELSKTIALSEKQVGALAQTVFFEQTGGKIQLGGKQTDKTGTFIICIPGVAFVMPMWGYALILVACVLVLGAGITLIIILVRKKKKRKANEV